MYCDSIYPQRIQNTMFDNDNVVCVFMNSGIISLNIAEYSIYWQYVVFLCKVLQSPPKNIEYTSYWQYVVLSLCIVVQSPQRQHKDIASMPETLQIYKHTHKSISLYLLRFLSFLPQKNFQKNICTGNIFSTRAKRIYFSWFTSQIDALEIALAEAEEILLKRHWTNF